MICQDILYLDNSYMTCLLVVIECHELLWVFILLLLDVQIFMLMSEQPGALLYFMSVPSVEAQFRRCHSCDPDCRTGCPHSRGKRIL